uniref:Solute carrier family 46 member 3 n=1 Tax=Paramormyrops kingsleyae TaxID=1676925 RepID=A0A3B3QHX9_9TELE|nr:solute carrier family 46 member 3-like [Paramormyrops kingsleyae]XP_023661139.1 solute carrier family 46 member 3-like [Paramormyrops kingsleyae]
MKGLYFVEPVVALYSFACFLIYPLVSQYVYRRMWQDLTNTTYPTTDNASSCMVNTNQSSHEKVQRAASLFSLYNELFSMIPSLIVTLLLVAYSDHRGRKISIALPLVGSLVYTSSFLAISFFELNIYLLIVANFASSLFGGVGTMLGGCFSYIADLCSDGKLKTLRMAGVDMVLGLLSGVASISTGYFLRASGFNWPFFTAFLCHAANLLYVIVLLEETWKSPDLQEMQPPLKKLVTGVYRLFALASRRRNMVLILLLLIFFTYSFSNIGGLALVTLYELNEPLCWSEILIGYGSALSTLVFLTSFIGVFILSHCLPNVAIVFVGLLSIMSGLIMTAFARTTLAMFLVRVPMLLAIMPAPVLRSMMSKIVSKSEQGALFACVACLENLSSNVAFAVFNSLYAATVAWFPGFSFLLAGGLCLLPVALLGVVAFLGPDEAGEAEALIAGEEAGDAPSI